MRLASFFLATYLQLRFLVSRKFEGNPLSFVTTMSCPSLSKWGPRVTRTFFPVFLKTDPGAWMWGNTDTGSVTSIDFRASFYTSEEKSPATLRMESVYQTDWDHYTHTHKKNFQEQRETWNCHDVTIFGQCFSSLVFIAFKLWLKRWIGRWFISLAFHCYGGLWKGWVAGSVPPNELICSGKWWHRMRRSACRLWCGFRGIIRMWWQPVPRRDLLKPPSSQRTVLIRSAIRHPSAGPVAGITHL